MNQVSLNNLTQKAEEARHQIQAREYSVVADEAVRHLERRNIEVDTNSNPFSDLCDGLLHAKHRAFEVMAEREQGNLNNRYDLGLVMKRLDPKLMLSTLVKDFLTAYKRKVGSRFYKRLEGNYRKVIEILGDMPTKEISKDHIQELFRELQNYPSNRFKPPYAGLTLAQCRTLTNFKATHSTTIKNTWFDVKRLLQHGHENEKYKLLRNFANDKEFRISHREKDAPLLREVYTSDDIACLYAGLSKENRIKQPQRFWIPLIGLFQGMRLNEICQLYPDY